MAALLAACSGSGGGVSVTPSSEASAPPSSSTTTAKTTFTIGAPAVKRCPAGSNPNVPGPIDQERGSGAVAFDAQSGVVVAVNGTRVWVFDVCTNMWERRSDIPVAAALRRLVYHPGVDRTFAFSVPSSWAYDVESDRWTEVPVPAAPADLVERLGAVFEFPALASVDPDSGRIFLGTGAGAESMFSFDPITGIWTEIPFESGPSWLALATYDPAVQGFVALVFIETPWATIQVLDTDGRITPVGDSAELLWSAAYYPTYMTFDEESGRAALFVDGVLTEYDAESEEWLVVWGDPRPEPGSELVAGDLVRSFHSVVYDSVNHRILVLGGEAAMPGGRQKRDDVWAFDSAGGEWLLLLEDSAA